jgi:hypothetical protein
MGKSISPVGLGRLMIKLYPEVKSKQELLNLISAINLFPFRISPVNMPTVIFHVSCE